VRTKKTPAVRETPTFIEAARRAQIIQAATETIAELGFINASLSQIAKRAGISKGVIGYYFPSKDDLVKAVVDNFYVTGHEEMMAEVSQATTPTEMLRLYILHNIGYIDRNRLATRAMTDIVHNFRLSDGELAYKPEDAQWLVIGTAALFDWGQEAGEFRPHNSRVMAVTLRSAIDTFAAELERDPDMDVDAYVAELQDLFVHAVQTTE